MKEIKIGDEMFFSQLDVFRMADGTMQIENRIAKIEILWHFNYKEDPIKYLFMVWEAQRQVTDDQLFHTKEEAIEYAKDRISKITIRDMEHELKQEEEIESIAAIDWKHHDTATGN